MSDREIKISTKAMLGVFGGLKASLLYSIFVSPVLARLEVEAYPK